MKYFTRYFRNAIGMLLIAIFAIWAISYPLHIIFGESSHTRLTTSESTHHSHSCCSDLHINTGKNGQSTIAEKVVPNPFCGLCDFALQFESNNIQQPFSIQICESVACHQLHKFYFHSFAFYNSHNSRAPPSEQIA